MSWGLIIKDVYLPRIHKTELSSRIEELEDLTKYFRDKLLALAVATPRQIKDAEGNPIEWENHIIFEINNMWEELEETIKTKYLCYIALNDLDNVEED